MNKRYLFIEERFYKISKITRKEKILKDNEERAKYKNSMSLSDYDAEYEGKTGSDYLDYAEYEGKTGSDYLDYDEEYEEVSYENTREKKVNLEIFLSGVPP